MRAIGRYRLVRELGAGGAATVFLARQLDLDRFVALKELSAMRVSDPTFARRFLRESRVAASLAHPNIVTVHDYFEERGTPYIAMEYLRRGSLRRHMDGLSLAQVGGVLSDVLAGLAHAERRGVVHRDLKPENLLVTDDGRIKITDFGIAKATRGLGTQSRLTATGTTLGTPYYMAPEQAMGRDVGPWSDLYSLGIIAFEMLVGEVPFGDTDEPMAVLMRQAQEDVPSVASLRPDLDPAVSGWVDRLLVKDPAQRIRSAVPAGQDLEEALIGVLGPRWHRLAGLGEAGGASAASRDTEATARLSRSTGAAATMPLGRTAATLPVGRTAATLPRGRTPTTMRHTGWATTVPPRTAATARMAEARPRRRRTAAKIAGLLLALLVLGGVALGAVRGGSSADAGSGPGGSGPTGEVTSTRELSLQTPPGWKRVANVPATGLPLSDDAALAPTSRADGPAVVFGLMRGDTAANSTLLPPAFLASLGGRGGAIPPRSQVTLASQELPAWRYRDLRPLGSTRALSPYVVPTTAGVATVACVAAPDGTAIPAAVCDAIASTLELRHARPYPIGPSDTYAAALRDTLRPLQRALAADGKALAAAPTPAAQARPAKSLAADYREAAGRLAKLTLNPADRDANAQLVAALRRAARGYDAVAAAAKRGDAAGVTRRRTAATSDENGVDDALGALRAIGYPVVTGADGAADPPPPAASQPPATPRTAPAPPRAAPRRAAPPPPAGGDGQSDDPSDDVGDVNEP